MKIVLISPYADLQSFGIRTLSASLKKNHHNVDLVFLTKNFGERYEYNVLEELSRLSSVADLIGISLMSNYLENAIQITEELKKICNVPIIWGGVHPTIRPNECLKYVDIVCIGEGEDVLLELTNKINKVDHYYNILGIHFKDGNKIIQNQLRPLIINLDDIPYPDYDYRTHYILDKNSIQLMDYNLFKVYYGRSYTTLPTRGCPYQCTYCCNNTLNKMFSGQKLVRKRSIDNIITELILAKKTIPFLEEIKFDDDAFFTLSIDEIKDFSEKYKENINLPLIITGTTPSTVNHKKISFLVDAGLYSIRMGIQTGSERTKKIYNRSFSNTQIINAVNIINQYKTIRDIQYDIILDNPWETDEDLYETLIFLTKLPTPFRLSIFSLNFYPGTELYEKAKNEGIIKNDFDDIYRKHYHNLNKTVINNLFFLLSIYASSGISIPTIIIILLFNKKIQCFHLHWFIYIPLKFFSYLIIIKGVLKYFLKESFKDIIKGDWSRIKKIINRYLHFLS